MISKFRNLIKCPENVFLFFSFFLGLGYLFSIPLMQNPDEKAHSLRVYQLSEGRLLYHRLGEKLPINFVHMTQKFEGDLPMAPERKTSLRFILENLSSPLQPENRDLFHFAQTGSYFPLAYTFQSAFLTFGRILGATPVTLLYLARLGGLVLFVIGGYWIIRTLPIAKWLFILLLLIPMNVAQSVAISSDGMTHFVSFMTLAIFLRIILIKGKPLRLSQWFGLEILLVLLTLFKAVYAPLSLLLLKIPKERFKNNLYRKVILILIPTSLLLTVLLWGTQIKGITGFRFDPDLKIQFIQHHPFQFLSLILKSIWSQKGMLLTSYIAKFGYLDTRVAILPQIYYVLTIFWVFFFDRSPPHLYQRIDSFLSVLVLTAACLSILGIYSYIYITWAEPYLPYISGVQGRYFIPLVPILLVACIPVCTSIHTLITKKLKIPDYSLKWIPDISISGIVILHAFSFYAVFYRFYGF